MTHRELRSAAQQLSSTSIRPAAEGENCSLTTAGEWDEQLSDRRAAALIRTSEHSQVTRRSRALVVLALLPLGLGLFACGTAPTAEPASDAGPVATSAVEVRANEIFASISGDAVEREASHYLTWKDLNAGYADCMRAAGHSVDLTFLPLWTGWEPDATSASWMGALNRPPSVHARAIAASSRAELGDGRVYSNAFNAASAKCNDGDTETVDLGNIPGQPEGAAELTDEFKQLVHEVDSRLGPIDVYTECMDAEGIDYAKDSGGEQGRQGLYRSLTAEMPYPPLPGTEEPPAWSDYLQRERQALAADNRCRRDRYEQGLRELAPLLDDFEAANRAAISATDRAWDATVAEATEAGFQPG